MLENYVYFIYNFNGDIYESTEAFDDTYRAKKRECIANGEPFSRQAITSTGKVVDEVYCYGAWIRA